ncbi:hypothetical protein APR41_18085 [Salegentibacter salinarum]|uniref:Sugar-binding protein n=1 Tax=Salegentibacter salinarum TaxID=447422 RepID=A0A2N0TTF9_9FLAO|nr:hypothetical protein APR41_18085 [Salegentibacter salinarum]
MFSSLIQGQNEDITTPNFTPPSPTAYELGKYGEFPIGMFTGTVNFSTPLLEFKTKEITIPLSINYSSSGIKVDQLASTVGLGWSLNSGGVITRVVNQNPDELRDYAPPTNTNDGYFSFEWVDYYNDLSYQVQGISQPLEIDGEPDIFSYNFLGRTGRFTFKNNNQREIVLLDNIGLEVVYNPEQSGGFLIRDENGFKYYFLDVENTKMETIGGSQQYNQLGRWMPTSWYITRIETPTGESVFFDYENVVYNYTTTQSQYATIPANATGIDSGPSCFQPYEQPNESPVIDHPLYVQGKQLRRISSSNPIHGEISLSYDFEHPQVPNYYLVSSIDKIYDINSIPEADDLVETINMNYLTVNQRVFLENVQFQDPDKIYSYEYIDVNNLPQRLSFSKDHWGYFNGKGNTKLYPDLSGVNNVYGNRFASVFASGANKEIDETKAKKGLLKKVVYPTKGYTEIEYESNTEYTSEESSSEANVLIEVETTDISNHTNSETVVLNDVEEAGIYPLDINFSLNYQSSCSTQGPTPDPADRKLFITIENLTNPSQTNIIHRMAGNVGVPISIGNSVSVTEEQSYNDEYFFNLAANDQYEVTVSLFYECLMGRLSFNYPNSSSTLTYTNKKTGGLRVAKTTNYDYDNEYLSAKKYYYASKDNLDRSSGVKGFDPSYYSYYTSVGACDVGGTTNPFCANWKIDYVRLNSGALNALYRTSIATTRYEYVTVSNDAGDLSNGGTEYKYKIASPSMSYNINGIFSPIFSEGQKSWGDGYELQKTLFKVDGSAYKNTYKEINDYIRDVRINDTVTGFKVSRKYNLPCRDFNTNDPEEQQVIIARDELNVTRFYLTSNWAYLKSKTKLTFDENGSNPSTEITSYYYDNEEHAQISRTETVNSKNDLLEEKIYYPDDFDSNLIIEGGNLTTAELNIIDRLKSENQHRTATPIQTVTKKNGSTIYIKRNNYDDFHGQTLQSSLETQKGSGDMEERITYSDYDISGNPQEVSKTNGPNVIYIWGYEREYPVAKIENAFLTDVLNLVDINLLNDPSTSELIMKEELEKIRTGLPQSMVTTYTYKPLVGLTSITDPSGLVTTYNYDDFNRLRFIKDDDWKILKEYDYHYKNTN